MVGKKEGSERNPLIRTFVSKVEKYTLSNVDGFPIRSILPKARVTIQVQTSLGI